MKIGLLLGSFVVSCMEGDAPALSRVAPREDLAANRPRAQLLTGASFVRITDRPADTARTIGYLPPRTIVAHDPHPHDGYGCNGKWFAIQPRGFICADPRSVPGQKGDVSKDTAGEDPAREPLDLSANLPYRYSRTTRRTALYEGAGGNAVLVNRTGTLPPNSSMAIIGAMGAHDERQGRRLAVMADGRFVDATALEPAEPSSFHGIALEGKALPLGFVSADGAQSFRLNDDEELEPLERFEAHRLLSLSGRTMRLNDVEYHHVRDDGWIAGSELSVISRRDSFPKDVELDTHWLDVDTAEGTLVVYEGLEPVFGTLVSVGEGPTGSAPDQHHTYPGWHRIVFKHVTGVGLEPSHFESGARIYDLPWAMQLSSGQYLHGSYWHSRFGSPHGPDNVQLSPADARRVFLWSSPQRPDNWHAVASADHGEATFVYVH